MISVAIVEDDNNYKDEIIQHLEKYSDEQGITFDIVDFSDGEDILESYSGSYDLILMDIEMKFLDGMSTAKRIREFDTNVAIMFITNAPQYAINGYLVDALDYVLKPINYFSFSKRLERALSKINKNDEDFITIQMKNYVKKLPIKDLLYIEVQNHDLIFKTKEHDYIGRGTLNDYEKSLKKFDFFRCHRSYLVNISKVDGYKGNEIDISSNIIPISRTTKKELMERLNAFL